MSQKELMKEWEFLARFCYKTDSGLLEFVFEYPEPYCCQAATLFYERQWKEVYPAPSMTCKDKLKVASEPHQVLPLSNSSGCSIVTIDKVNRIVCKNSRPFSSSVPKWWYLVISHCGTDKGLSLKYKMIMTNGDTFWTRHFSADEQNILQTDIAFLIFFAILLFLSMYEAYMLHLQQLFHTTYKMFMWAVFFELLSVIVNIVYYSEYGLSGKPVKGVKNMGRCFHCISDTMMVVLLILLGKGWTVTRSRISPSGQIKLSVFCTLYGIAYVSLFIYEARAFDPGEVLYIYESPAGVGICIMKVVAWIWFCYGVFFTLKNYNKHDFYLPFFSFYTMWFLSGPVIVLIATQSIQSYVREQIVNGVDRCVAFVAFGFFLMLTRPSAANKNFPYHVRTTQIGFIDDSADPNFERSSYKPAEERVTMQKRMNTLFAVNNGSTYPKQSTMMEGARPLNGSFSQTPSLNSNSESYTPFVNNNKNQEGVPISLGRTNLSYNDIDNGNGDLPTTSQHPQQRKYTSMFKAGKDENQYSNTTESPVSTNSPHNSNFVTTEGTMYPTAPNLEESHRKPSLVNNTTSYNANFSTQLSSDNSLNKRPNTLELEMSEGRRKDNTPSPHPNNAMPPPRVSAPLIRTEEQVTSLFSAKPSEPVLSPITPMPLSNNPSPSFFIPEPPLPNVRSENFGTTSKTIRNTAPVAHEEAPIKLLKLRANSDDTRPNVNVKNSKNNNNNNNIRENDNNGTESTFKGSRSSPNADPVTTTTTNISNNEEAVKSQRRKKTKKRQSKKNKSSTMGGEAALPPLKVGGGKLPPLGKAGLNTDSTI